MSPAEGPRRAGSSARRSGQLELPLDAVADRAPRPTRPRTSRGGSRRAGWRLDEETRRIGREGVAAARALLERNGTDDGHRAASPGSPPPEVRPERAA